MVHFVGAGPGAPDLITRRGAALLADADCIIYAGSLVNPALLGLAKPGCAIYNSAEMTLEQVLDTIRAAEKAGGTTVRLHTGDPCLYGAIREQMDALDADGIPYDDTPGVSSFCGAAAALNAEYTLPTVIQTVIITRMEGRYLPYHSYGRYLSSGPDNPIHYQRWQTRVYSRYHRKYCSHCYC